MIVKKICPVCNTDEFVTYDGGSHAGGPSHESHCGAYLCDKCGGEFTLRYEIKDNKITHMGVEYNSKRAERSNTQA